MSAWKLMLWATECKIIVEARVCLTVMYNRKILTQYTYSFISTLSFAFLWTFRFWIKAMIQSTCDVQQTVFPYGVKAP